MSNGLLHCIELKIIVKLKAKNTITIPGPTSTIAHTYIAINTYTKQKAKCFTERRDGDKIA
jgi:hypothetical protein